jgi:phosphatidylserine/phosphatidylglycerophosphate/cardiolipin synthase-like enzyme
MQLLVQPEDSLFPILKAIKGARRTIDVHIFRLDRGAIEKELKAAVARGVVVRTLIAHTNARGEKGLRKLEQRLLALGATVSRTADDLVRYHGKVMIVDRVILYVLGYNFTALDIDESRSLGIATRKRELVQEALRLFDADFDRKPYTSGAKGLVVSPVNARERLGAFVKKARQQLLIYDTALTDDEMIRLLQERVAQGVDVRIIGKVEKGHDGVEATPYAGKRLHVRALVRDGTAAFVGSQSLRKLELDARREIGVLVNDAKVTRRIREIFESDWAETNKGKKEAKKEAKAAKAKEKRKKRKGKPRA